MTDSARERDALAAIARWPACRGGAQLARFLNLRKSGGRWRRVRCAWCPVGPPRPGEQCASVPRRSREVAARVLRALASKGLLVHLHPGTRLSTFLVPEGGAE